MRVDKKARGATLQFIVLAGIGHLRRPTGRADAFADAFAEVS